MSTQMLIWFFVAAAAVSLIVVKSFLSMGVRQRRAEKSASTRRHAFKWIEVGEEWEEFYVPGDRRLNRNDTDDYGE